MGWYDYGPRRDAVTVAELRAKAERKIKRLQEKGQQLQPVRIEGRTISRSFWGKAWCTNLERYSDFSNRLPRGRRYVVHGTVIDLRIETGRVQGLVVGSSLYEVDIRIAPLNADQWTGILEQCRGSIQTLVELLRGEISAAVMQIVTREGSGLFPSPSEIQLECTCPDWADMCKHVAAVLYGVGARLDENPALLFTLRDVDPAELVDRAADSALVYGELKVESRLKTNDLSAVFGIHIEEIEGDPPALSPSLFKRPPRTAGRRKTRSGT